MLLKNCNKKQKQERKNKTLLYLAKNQLDFVEMLVSKSVMDGIIGRNEFSGIIKEKTDYDSQKIEGDKSKISDFEIVEKNKTTVVNHQLSKV